MFHDGSSLSSVSPPERATLSAAVLMMALLTSAPLGAQARDTVPDCKADGQIATIAELPEASGIAASRRVPGRLWALNDSGDPVLVALDTRGAVTGRLRLSGAGVEDWEALAIGPCAGASCLYVADIGDNDAQRKRVTIYRLPEPAAAETSADVKDVFHATYPDGAHDAEALLVTPDGDLLIVTKGDTGAIALYRFPRELRPGATHQLERVGKPRGRGRPAANQRVTDGSVSADGRWVVLRTGDHLTFHRAAELLAGDWNASRTIDLTSVGEVQGEGIAIGADGTVYLAGEGGGKKRPGTFARLTCTSAF